MEEGFLLLLQQLVPYIIAWHCLYWVAFAISPYLFPTTFDKLDDAKGEKGYWAASVVSTVHAIVLSIVSALVFWQDPSLLYSEDWLQKTQLSVLSCYIFTGYILSDSLVSLYFNSRWAGWQANLAHHAAVTIAWSQLTMGAYAQGIAMFCQLMEITTPFINLRWFLDKADLKTGKLYFYNGVLMVILWFIFRILGYMYAAKQLYVQRQGLFSLPLFNQIAFGTCFVVGFMLQSFWFYKLMRGALKAIKKKDSGKEYTPMPATALLEAKEEGLSTK